VSALNNQLHTDKTSNGPSAGGVRLEPDTPYCKTSVLFVQSVTQNFKLAQIFLSRLTPLDKIIGVIIVDFDIIDHLLIKHCAFFRYWRKY
jgi:hypothetical protein